MGRVTSPDLPDTTGQNPDHEDAPPDGVRTMVPRNQMTPGARKLRDAYARVPGAPLFQREFGFYSLEQWREQGLSPEADLEEVFQLDPVSHHNLGQVGWCEAAFQPAFDVEVLEDRGDYELVRDFAGRSVLYFKGRRDGFMPEYLDHPVKDRRTWDENVKWRLDPHSPERWENLEQRMEAAKADAARGLMIQQPFIGGYMYLRSLIGPAELLTMFYDQPDLIEDCLEAWFRLADHIIAIHQQHVTLDEAFFAEDICYNHGPLISPAMIRRFLLPYYQQLFTNMRRRQIDQSRHLYIQLDTDGYAVPVLPVYAELGVDVFSPVEVASGCDPLEIGRHYPDWALFGGIDKRVLASTKGEIDRMLERILPPMRERGGYIPTCDHGVPAEVPLENYLHFRKRAIELGQN